MARVTSCDTDNNNETSNESLIETARKVQKQKMKEFDKVMEEREVFLRTILKMRSQQKYILIWLWKKTQTLETFLDKVDHDTNFLSEIKSSEHIVWEWWSGSASLDNLSEHQRVVLENVNTFRAARLYRSSGIRWSIRMFATHKPTPSQKASISRSLSRLVVRKLVVKDKNRGTVKLTKLGRDVSEKLTCSVSLLESSYTLEEALSDDVCM